MAWGCSQYRTRKTARNQRNQGSHLAAAAATADLAPPVLLVAAAAPAVEVAAAAQVVKAKARRPSNALSIPAVTQTRYQIQIPKILRPKAKI